MPKELSSDISIQRINLTCTASAIDPVVKAMNDAKTGIVGNYRSKFDRKTNQTTIEADVFLEASSDSTFSMKVSARVSMVYQGDQVRCSPSVRDKISSRLVEHLQRHCSQLAIAEAIKSRRNN